jgi:hypothetical protein
MKDAWFWQDQRPAPRPEGRLRSRERAPVPRVAGLVLAGGLLWGVTALALATVAGQAWSELLGRPLPRPEDLVALLAAVLGLALVTWCAVAALLTGVAVALPASSAAARGLQRCAGAVAPRLLRRAVCAALGVALLGAAAPATAEPGPGSAPCPAPAAVTGWAPGGIEGSTERPPAGSTAQEGSAPGFGWFPPVPARIPVQGGRTVTVHAGDTLWALAARQLGPEASAARIAQAWPRWYALNRDVIGPDPDRLRPGQRLRVPQERR